MSYRFPFIVIFLLLLTVISWPGMLSASTAPYLVSKSRMEILLGKLCVMAPEGRLGQINLKSTGQTKFLFSLKPDSTGIADFSYRYFNQNYFGWIECQNGFIIQEFWAELPTKKYLRYQQPANGQEIILEFGTLSEEMLKKIRNAGENENWFEQSGQNVQIWKAHSFWEFLFFYSTECDEALSFLLSKHWENANAKISECRQNLLDTMLQNTQDRISRSDSQTFKPRSRMEIQQKNQKLLNDLSSEDFTVRRNADLALRQLGAEIFFLAGECDWKKFSPETQFRLNRILSDAENDFSLEEKSLDWDSRYLVDFPQMWLGVLEFGTVEQKQFALRLLSENADTFFENPAAFHAISLTAEDLADSSIPGFSSKQETPNLGVASETNLPPSNKIHPLDESSPSENRSEPGVKPPKSNSSLHTEISKNKIPHPNAAWLEKINRIKKLSLKNQLVK
ncbi:MAG: hypothetical protein IJF17_07150 [Thermoguttaceae bacterium]|nr:hypothetical protein [Thermoguttaceae bacterium]